MIAKAKLVSRRPSKFRDWYAKPKNREALNKRRRAKYHKDPKYREKVLENTQAWRKEQALAKVDQPPKPKTSFTIGDAAEMIGCEQKTIRTLEKNGLIPNQADGRTHRRYTKKQIDLMQSLVNLRKTVHYRNPTYAPRLKKMSARVHANWE